VHTNITITNEKQLGTILCYWTCKGGVFKHWKQLQKYKCAETGAPKSQEFF